MPLDNPEQTDDSTLDWSSAPDQFRAALDRNKTKLAEAEARLETLTRENTARAAGLDITTPLGQMFLDSYKGDVTPDAMKTAWESLGVAAPTTEPPATPPPNDEPSAEEREFERLRGAIHGQSTPPGTEPPGDIWLGPNGVFPTFQQNLKSGMRRDDAGAAALDVLFAAAMDPSHPQHDQAVWNRQRWLEQSQ